MQGKLKCNLLYTSIYDVNMTMHAKKNGQWKKNSGKAVVAF